MDEVVIMTDKDYFHLPTLKTRIAKRRRHLSITLKIPDVASSSLKSSSVKLQPTAEIIRTSSVMGEYKPQKENLSLFPLHQTTVSFGLKSRNDAVPYFFSPIKNRYSPLPPRNTIRKTFVKVPELTIKAEKKLNPSPSVDQALLCHLKKFFINVQSKFSKTFTEIDRENKGFFDLDNLIDYFILKNMHKENLAYEKIRLQAVELHKTFELISGQKTTNNKTFFAYCSVFEYNKGENLELNDRKIVKQIKTWIIELRDLFECFTDKKTLDVRAVLIEICLKDRISEARKFVEGEKIDFCRFLRCLPFFVWVYNSVNNSNY